LTPALTAPGPSGQTEIDVRARHEARFSGDAALKRRAEAERSAALAILDRALAGRPYLLGNVFTLADLNLAATLSEPWENGLIDGEVDPLIAAREEWRHVLVGWEGLVDPKGNDVRGI